MKSCKALRCKELQVFFTKGKQDFVLSSKLSTGVIAAFWEQGGIVNGTGAEYASTTNIRTKMITVTSGETISVTPFTGFVLWAHEYTDVSTYKQAVQITGVTYTPTTAYVRFRMTYTNTATSIIPSDVPCIFYANEGFVTDMINTLDNDISDIRLLNRTKITVAFESVAQNIDCDFAVKAGKTYVLYTENANLSGKINVFVKGTATNIGYLESGVPLTYTPQQNGTLRFFNNATISGNFTGTLDVYASYPLQRFLDEFTVHAAGKHYATAASYEADYPGKTLGEIPPGRIILLSAPNLGISDIPTPTFLGEVFTLSYKNNAATPGNVQLAIGYASSVKQPVLFYRYYMYTSGGDYWLPWVSAVGRSEEYHVGATRDNTSLVSLLLDLNGNNLEKTIYIDEGTYDIFAEYVEEVEAGRIEIPDDDITSPDYFEPYNAFVPNNTKIIGLGNVTLKMTPTVAQLESLSDDPTKTGYGASRTWSPLNIYGNCTIENITVLGHNCRYCLHNDDHNAYPNAKQYYKAVNFRYEYSDLNSSNQRLGFNNTIGFGIQNGGIHTFEDCEIYMDTSVNASAYYGHEGNSNKNGTLILKNCKIHSSNFSNNTVIRLQSLGTSQGKVNALFENCYINGGLMLNLYYTNSVQNFETTFINCNKVPVSRTVASGGTITDIYAVKWYNPLPTPTAENPLIETDSYSA